ncbi:hypothetical protein [Streptomyces sp. A5-4]|uniref:hypothetical protein n=1 Tax=Streptomyces sp. A5-4 TaxID=3384771 RepID=UPI003DA984AB
MDALTLRLSLVCLGTIALPPFPTTMLSEYASQPLAVVSYASIIVVIDPLLLAIFLSVWRRPRMAHPVPRHVGRKIVTDLVSNVVVFGATMPIAFVSPAAAMWSWLSLAPIKWVLWWSQRGQPGADAAEPQPAEGRNASGRASERVSLGAWCSQRAMSFANGRSPTAVTAIAGDHQREDVRP